MNKLELEDEREDSNDVILLFNTKTGSVQINYLTVDPRYKRKILPKVNHVTWPKLKHIVDYAVVVFDNILYVLGGQDLESGKQLASVMKFDPTTNKWTSCSAMKKARSKFTACVMDKRIFVAGGEVSEDGATTDSCEAYEPLIDMWSPEGKMITPRKDHACIAWAERLYLSGGSRNMKDYYCNNFWQMKKHFPNPMVPEYKYKWFHMGPNSKNCLLLPRKVREHSMVVCNDTLYLMGGVAEGLSYDGQYLYDPKEDQVATPFKQVGIDEDLDANTDTMNDSAKADKVKTTETFQKILQSKSQLSELSKTIQATSQFMDMCNLNLTLPAIPPPEIKTSKKEKKNGPTQPLYEKEEPNFVQCANIRYPRTGAATVALEHRIYLIGGHTYEDPDVHVDMIEYYHTKKRKWFKAFPLGEGNFCDVKCCVLNVPSSNPDFKNIFPYNWPLW